MKTTHGVAGIDGGRGDWFVATRSPGKVESLPVIECVLVTDTAGTGHQVTIATRATYTNGTIGAA